MRILPIKTPARGNGYHTKYAYQVQEKLDDGTIAWTTVATLQIGYFDRNGYLFVYKFGKENDA